MHADKASSTQKQKDGEGDKTRRLSLGDLTRRLSGVGMMTRTGEGGRDKKPGELSRRQSIDNVAVNHREIGSSHPGLEERTYGMLRIALLREAVFDTMFLFHICFYLCLVGIILHVDGANRFLEYLSASSNALGFASVFIGFSVVFRTQICYNRWWEGRCLWGALIFAAINLVQQGKCWIKDKDNLRRLCCLVVSFSYACKCQLQGKSIRDAYGEYLLKRGLVTEEDLEAITGRHGWQPYYFLEEMRAVIYDDLMESSRTNSDGFSYRGATADSQIMIYEESLQELAKSIGGMIRVKATGLPLGYDFIFYLVLTTFFTIATMAWAPALGWYAAVVIGFSGLAVRLFICLGSNMEDPFGDEITDLPLQKFCLATETQVEAVFRGRFRGDGIDDDWPFKNDLGISATCASARAPDGETVQASMMSADVDGSV